MRQLLDYSELPYMLRRLRELAEAQNLPLRAVAKRVGVSHQTIDNWYRGSKPLPAHEEKIYSAVKRLEAGDHSLAPELEKDREDFRRLLYHGLLTESTKAEQDILQKAWPSFAWVQTLMDKYGQSMPQRIEKS